MHISIKILASVLIMVYWKCTTCGSIYFPLTHMIILPTNNYYYVYIKGKYFDPRVVTLSIYHNKQTCKYFVWRHTFRLKILESLLIMFTESVQHANQSIFLSHKHITSRLGSRSWLLVIPSPRHILGALFLVVSLLPALCALVLPLW